METMQAGKVYLAELISGDDIVIILIKLFEEVLEGQDSVGHSFQQLRVTQSCDLPEAIPQF